MQSRWLAAVLLSACSVAAHADTYDFLYTGFLFPGGPSFSPVEFQVTNPPSAYDGTSFTYDTPDFSQYGIADGLGPYVSFTKDSLSIFGFLDPNDNALVITDANRGNAPFFTGSTSAPVFVTQAFAVDSSFTYYAGGGAFYGTLTVTDASAQQTPEPSSLVLLGTGVLGVLGLAWRDAT